MIPAGRVKRPRVEKEPVSRLELRPHRLLDERTVLGQDRPAGKRPRRTGADRTQAMRPGDQVQAAVVGVLRRERQPDADQVGPLERPVADVLVPPGVAAMAGLLGHDAIVMRQGHHDLWSQELLQPAGKRGRGDPFGETKIARSACLSRRTVRPPSASREAGAPG